MGDPRTGTPEEQGPEFVDEPFNEPGQQTTPPGEVEPEQQSDG
jgi:hypothetical protein